MKKLFSTILVLGLLLSGNAYADAYSRAKVLLKDNDKVHIFMKKGGSAWERSFQIGSAHCASVNKFAFLVKRGSFKKEKIDKHYIKNSKDNYVVEKLKNKRYSIKEVVCSTRDIFYAPSFAFNSGNKIFRKFSNYNPNLQLLTNNSNQNVSVEFNIKQKKEQCEAIGFKPKTEKFADCVLRLVELDVKQQQSNKIAQAQNSGNDALVRQLKQQQYDRGTDALLNLGQQLLKPKQYNSNIYMPQTQRCTIQGFGTFAKMVCR